MSSVPAVSALLLDPPLLTPDEVGDLERSLAALLGTSRDLVLFPSEATLALEAVAAGLGQPGHSVLNVVTGPYGRQFGEWLRRAGSGVLDLTVPFDRSVTIEEIAAILDRESIDVVSVVHAEAATGVVNPLAAICAAAKQAGALVVVDAVASVGAEPLDIDGWDIDLCAVGAQKALAGPFGVSAVTVSAPGWAALRARNPPLRQSSLSLLDWKDRWIDGGRSAIPVYLPVLETRAMQAAVDRVLGEGVAEVADRHRRAAAASRAGSEALGLRPWVADPADAAAIATLLRPPEGVASRALAAAALGPGWAPVEAAPGELADAALRITHTGRRATLPDVLSALVAISGGLEQLGSGGAARLSGAVAAARSGWDR